jgi:hypothetical protein
MSIALFWSVLGCASTCGREPFLVDEVPTKNFKLLFVSKRPKSREGIFTEAVKNYDGTSHNFVSVNDLKICHSTFVPASRSRKLLPSNE